MVAFKANFGCHNNVMNSFFNITYLLKFLFRLKEAKSLPQCLTHAFTYTTFFVPMQSIDHLAYQAS